MNVLDRDLSKFSKQEIISGLTDLVKTERKVTLHVLRFINEIASRKIFLEDGFDSMMKYLVEVHKYSERSALRRMNAAKVLIQCPDVSEKIESGRLKLSQFEKVHQGIQPRQKAGKSLSVEQTAEILAQMEDLNTFESERVLAVELDFKPKIFQKAQPQKDGSVRLEITLFSEEYELLRRAQSYISHSVPSNDLAKAIAYLAKCQIKKVEGKSALLAKVTIETEEIVSTKSDSTPCAGEAPIRKQQKLAGNLSELQIKKDQRPSSPDVRHQRSEKFGRHSRVKRKYIRRRIRRSLLKKAGHRCSYQDPTTGRICGSRFQLQIDHIVPLSKGGIDEFNNYRILCGIHNRYEAEQWGLC